MTAFDKGYESASLNKSMLDNPYEEKSFNWYDWRRGYLECREDKREKFEYYYDEDDSY